MKENSIEGTIKQLELILKARKIHKECVGESCTNCNPDIEALTNTIEFLSDYKRLQKENEELKLKNKTLEELLQGNLYELYKYYRELTGTYQSNCILVQKVKDKIEELKQLEFSKDLVTQSTANLTTICILQKLIEESED